MKYVISHLSHLIEPTSSSLLFPQHNVRPNHSLRTYCILLFQYTYQVPPFSLTASVHTQKMNHHKRKMSIRMKYYKKQSPVTSPRLLTYPKTPTDHLNHLSSSPVQLSFGSSSASEIPCRPSGSTRS